MKHPGILFIFCLSILSISCASAPPSAPPPASTAALPAKADIWPKIYNDETYLTTFASTWSEDEAVGVIRNLQNSMVDFSANLPLSELNVDPYGMRARWSWIENGSFQKSAGFIVPFDQVSSMLLERYPAIDKVFKWGLLIYIAGTSPVSVRTPTREAAERLGKAVLVLAKARNAKVSVPNVRFGAALGPLSDAQAQAAGIPQTGGIIINWIFKESPAEKAGFSPQDIITGIAGKPVQKGDDLFSAIDAAAASGAKEIKVSGIRRSYRAEGKTFVEIFVPLTFTLTIDQTGEAK